MQETAVACSLFDAVSYRVAEVEQRADPTDVSNSSAATIFALISRLRRMIRVSPAVSARSKPDRLSQQSRVTDHPVLDDFPESLVELPFPAKRW